MSINEKNIEDYRFFKELVASPLVMWLGVSRDQFSKPKKAPENPGDNGAVV